MKAFFFFLLILSPFILSAQDDEAKKSPCAEVANKKAVKLYEKGIDKKNHNLEEKVHFLKEAVELEPDYAEALYALGDGQRRLAKVKGLSYKPMEESFLKVLALCPDYNPYVNFYLGQFYYSKEDYPNTIKYLKVFLKNSDNAKNDNDYNEAESMLSDAKFYDQILNHPVPFNPEPVEGVSSQYNEYLAIISHDNEMCLFTRKLPVKSKDRVYESDQMAEVFMYSKRPTMDGTFDNGTIFQYPFQVGENYGGATLTVDNKIMYVTVCKKGKGGYTNCDIYQSKWSDTDQMWSDLENLGTNVNTEDGWESQPTISSDGKTLIFATARANSRGVDLFYSTLNAQNEWSKALPLSPKINTDGNDKTPFLHSDSHTLYFASDGRRGLGGYDIYFTRMNEKGEWDTPKNLGSPINTDGDEYGFFVSMDGHLGYFASNNVKTKNKGGIDVYRFELYKEARPEKVMLMKGELKETNGDPIINASIEVKDPATNQVQQFAVDKNSGKYTGIVRLPKDHNLVMTIKSPENAPKFSLITPKDSVSAGKLIKQNYEMPLAKVGGTYTINDIHYETNSSKLLDESLLILKELANYMKDHEMKIAIQGHTDNVGNDAANLALSTDRAFSVYDYLMDLGIDKEHMQFKGFGETKPVATNDTEAGRLQNRRTEFVILGMKKLGE